MIVKKIEPKRYIKLRIVATLIDYGIYVTLFYLYMYCFGSKNEMGSMKVSGFLALPLFIFWFLYFVVVEFTNGSTPGHDICKLVVVKTNGNKITFTDAFKRRITDLVDIGIYGIPALICIYNTPKYQRLGDLIADTVVIKRSDIIETEVKF